MTLFARRTPTEPPPAMQLPALAAVLSLLAMVLMPWLWALLSSFEPRDEIMSTGFLPEAMTILSAHEDQRPDIGVPRGDEDENPDGADRRPRQRHDDREEQLEIAAAVAGSRCRSASPASTASRRPSTAR
jgi:ABC-type glycerol-3-phosphate transport system permease component